MTELIWNGKYDEKGNLKPVDRIILPFLVVETIVESKAGREKAQRDLFTKQAHDPEWRNLLVWGDNIGVAAQASPPASSSPESIRSLRPKPTTSIMAKTTTTGLSELWTRSATRLQNRLR
ncbi:MAG: hypothetical protein Q8Q12_10615 [bacterium]|nr:hypothetical protein [bacterium]